MEFVFKTQKEHQTLVILIKYYSNIIEKHKNLVLESFNMAIENGYEQSNIEVNHSLIKGWEPEWSNDYNSGGGYDIYILSTTISTEHSSKIHSISMHWALGVTKEYIYFENTKQANDEILSKNKEIDNDLELLAIIFGKS
jgi:hypothetical protein